MKKRILALLLTLCMVLALLPHTTAHAEDGNNAEAPQAVEQAAETKASGGTTVLAFTSDIHNGAGGIESNISNNRLTSWLSIVSPKYNNDIHVFGFCGDMAGANTGTDTFWTCTQKVMDNISDHGMTGVYAVGNHEYMNGSFASTSNSPEVRAKYSLNAEGRAEADDNYVMYCLGTNSSHGSSWAYDDSQITTLTNYLNSQGNDKVIIILTHFPLHNYGGHRTSNTLPVLNAINAAAVGSDGQYGTADDKKIVFLWGHNHSEGDTNYDQIWIPGDQINNDNKSTVYFYYAAAGCMADTEYGQSASVKGKGLVLTINNKNQLDFKYYDLNGNQLATEGSYYTEQDPVAINSVTITAEGNTFEVLEGRKLQLGYTTDPADATTKTVTWSSSNENVATVDSTGLVKGKNEGTTVITLTISDGMTKNTVTATKTITVAHNDNPTQEVTISVTPSTSNPEQNIDINVGDTLFVNVTNGSSSTAYDYSVSFSKSGIASVDSSSINIAAGATAQFTFTGDADGKVDITIKNNQSSSSYVRKATIHLTVGDGSSAPVTGGSVDITPTTSNPEESAAIYVGDTLTINVTNSSSNSAYDFTASLSDSSIAQIQGSSTVNIAAGGTGEFTVAGVAVGTVDITIQNNNSYGSQYTRKGIIHLTVSEVTNPVAVTGVTVSPTTATVEARKTVQLTATVAPANATNKSVTWSSSNPSVATVSGGVVTALAEGTAVITAETVDGGFTDTCTVTVTPAKTVQFVLTDTLEDGKEYLIVNANTGSAYAVSNEANGSKTLKGVAVTIVDGVITITETAAANVTFTSEGRTSTSGTASFWLKNGGNYLYADSSNGLRLVDSSTQTSSSNNTKVWHYKADSKNLLWFFKDTSSSDGYTDTSSTYKYYLDYDNGNFKDAYVSTTSLANTTTDAIYLFEKADHVHSWSEEPTWTWTGNVEKREAVSATATFTCSECGEEKVIDADIATDTTVSPTKYTATVAFNNKTYTDVRYEKAPGEAYTIYITADKTQVQPGDTITFTITLGPVEHFGTVAMELVIPEGLTFVSGALAEGLQTTLGFDQITFLTDAAPYIINGAASYQDYASTSDTVIATFQCTVGNNFTGPAQIGLLEDELEICSCVDWTDYTSLYSIESDTITLADTYTITFKANDGASTADVTQAAVGGEETTLNANTFAREGYTFTGWNTAADGSGTAYADKAKVTLTANLTLYAQWKINTFTVTFNANGHGTAPAAQTVEYNGKATKPADPTATGYTFGGWYKEAACTNAYDFTTPVTADITLYAKWTAITFTIRFVDYDGETLLYTQTVNYGETPVYSGPTPTREGNAQYSYNFNGWDPEIVAATANATYTAQYTMVINTYTVTWVNYDGTVLEVDENVEYGTRPQYNGATPTRPSTSQYVYTFSGWSPSITTVSADVTYTAQFTTEQNVHKISGTIESFTITEEGKTYGDGAITIELFAAGSDTALKTDTATGTNATYELTAVPSGLYTLKVSKADHAARTYNLTVEADVTQDVKIHLIGDVTGDGKVTTIDFAMVNWYATFVKYPDNYQFTCADVNEDGDITTVDVGLVNSHARKMTILWEVLNAQQP